MNMNGRIAQLEARIPERVNVLQSPEWIAVRRVLLEGLVPFPEARVAVAEALMKLEVA